MLWERRKKMDLSKYSIVARYQNVDCTFVREDLCWYHVQEINALYFDSPFKSRVSLLQLCEVQPIRGWDDPLRSGLYVDLTGPTVEPHFRTKTLPLRTHSDPAYLRIRGNCVAVPNPVGVGKGSISTYQGAVVEEHLATRMDIVFHWYGLVEITGYNPSWTMETVLNGRAPPLISAESILLSV